MEENFRTVQSALDTGNDTLFEVSRQRLPDEVARQVSEARRQLAEARAALVRLEAEMLKCARTHGWSHESASETATHSAHS